ncbi:unnamed protein product [Aspergillus oryzae RIB40]|uniref:Large ribosomal subunit protein mL53 n=5 Tax=Aspergillus subgen. Circumdati TaxID=2720871 RepID=Q2UQ05_ASPOR|nr:unnamed protein product [Aspergillus oryzae RIB40]EIT79776.1 hypothetical protein Ao3042_03845 [Aspergillus oryzae 3.042]KDE79941.1 hypothetical protein AO1008_06244 [Aspergillus oryzae 100-8]KOC08386.1 hypothetical protein AFLA70_96g002911 [Aspergillus flavus AF70]BAE56360.1 unnamed protein product [Aspergillus oryzae RIB40]|eukprot:EIT79776.1 hypothetical protein Ao3042_03845 [Aspergillus oryzae 3.042]
MFASPSNTKHSSASRSLEKVETSNCSSSPIQQDRVQFFKMTIPVQTITTLRTSFNPFSKSSRPCRILLSILRNPNTAPASSPTHIDIKVNQLPRVSTQQPEVTVGFKGGKELKIEVGKRQLKIGDVIEEIARVGRAIEREESLKG